MSFQYASFQAASLFIPVKLKCSHFLVILHRSKDNFQYYFWSCYYTIWENSRYYWKQPIECTFIISTNSFHSEYDTRNSGWFQVKRIRLIHYFTIFFDTFIFHELHHLVDVVYKIFQNWTVLNLVCPDSRVKQGF